MWKGFKRFGKIGGLTKMKEEYPEQLTENESEYYPSYKQFAEADSFKEDFKQASEYAEKTGGVVYTMVDGEDGKTIYWKGLHYVNRFGFCVLNVKEVEDTEE